MLGVSGLRSLLAAIDYGARRVLGINLFSPCHGGSWGRIGPSAVPVSRSWP